MAEYLEMFTLKEEYITPHFVQNQQSILKMMTTERFPFWVQPSFVGIATCLFFPLLPSPLVLNAKNVALWLHQRINPRAEQEVSRCGVLLLFHCSALSSLVITPAVLPPAVCAITDGCFMWFALSKSEQPPTLSFWLPARNQRHHCISKPHLCWPWIPDVGSPPSLLAAATSVVYPPQESCTCHVAAPSWCELALLCLPVARVASQSNSLPQRGGRSRPALSTDRVLCALREFQVKEKKKKKVPFWFGARKGDSDLTDDQQHIFCPANSKIGQHGPVKPLSLAIS